MTTGNVTLQRLKLNFYSLRLTEANRYEMDPHIPLTKIGLTLLVQVIKCVKQPLDNQSHPETYTIVLNMVASFRFYLQNTSKLHLIFPYFRILEAGFKTSIYALISSFLHCGLVGHMTGLRDRRQTRTWNTIRRNCVVPVPCDRVPCPEKTDETSPQRGLTQRSKTDRDSSKQSPNRQTDGGKEE